MVVERLTGRDVWKIQYAWRRVYARRLHRLTGHWVREGSDRCIFHPGALLKYLKGAPAEEEYWSAMGSRFYVIDDSGESAEIHDEKPDLATMRERTGYLVFPNDLSWTFAGGTEYSDRMCFAYQEWVDNAASGDLR
jgi:hypothetical protein